MGFVSFSLLVSLLLPLTGTVVAAPHQSLSVSVDIVDIVDDYPPRVLQHGSVQHMKVASDLATSGQKARLFEDFDPHEGEKLVHKTISFDNIEDFRPPTSGDSPIQVSVGLPIRFTEDFKKVVDTKGHSKAYGIIPSGPLSPTLSVTKEVTNITIVWGICSADGKSLTAAKYTAAAAYYNVEDGKLEQKKQSGTSKENEWLSTGDTFRGLETVESVKLSPEEGFIILLSIDYDVWEWAGDLSSPSKKKVAPGRGWDL